MSDLTVVIPTYNRPECLNRLLKYYHEIDLDINYVVADSSEDCIKRKNLNTCSSIELPVSYIDSYPADTKLIDKIKQALAGIDTSYTVLCPDDDFLTPSGIFQAKDFLSDNSDFSCAHGNYISYDIRRWRDELFVTWKPRYPKSKSITARRPERRISEYLGNYVPTFYAVHRTSSLRKYYELTNNATDDVRLGELLPPLLSLTDGPIKHMNILYGARYTIGGTSASAKNILDYIHEDSFSKKYRTFQQHLVGHMTSTTDLSADEAAEAVDEGMVRYLVNSYSLSERTARSAIAGDPVNRRRYEASLRGWLRKIATELAQRINFSQQMSARRRHAQPVQFKDEMSERLDSPKQGRVEFEHIQDTIHSHPNALAELFYQHRCE